MQIRSEHKKGISYAEIAKKYNIDLRTAKKYALSDSKTVYKLSEPKPSMLNPYRPQIDLWLDEAPYNAVRILEKLEEQGLPGKYTIVREYSQQETGAQREGHDTV